MHQHPSAQEFFLPVAANLRQNDLTAVAFNLEVREHGAGTFSFTFRQAQGERSKNRSCFCGACPELVKGLRMNACHSITFFSIGSTVIPCVRNHSTARSISSAEPSSSSAIRPISLETLAPRMLEIGRASCRARVRIL